MKLLPKIILILGLLLLIVIQVNTLIVVNGSSYNESIKLFGLEITNIEHLKYAYTYSYLFPVKENLLYNSAFILEILSSVFFIFYSIGIFISMRLSLSNLKKNFRIYILIQLLIQLLILYVFIRLNNSINILFKILQFSILIGLLFLVEHWSKQIKDLTLSSKKINIINILLALSTLSIFIYDFNATKNFHSQFHDWFSNKPQNTYSEVEVKKACAASDFKNKYETFFCIDRLEPYQKIKEWGSAEPHHEEIQYLGPYKYLNTRLFALYSIIFSFFVLIIFEEQFWKRLYTKVTSTKRNVFIFSSILILIVLFANFLLNGLQGRPTATTFPVLSLSGYFINTDILKLPTELAPTSAATSDIKDFTRIRTVQDKDITAILIEGLLQPGDSKKFFELLTSNKGNISEVYLYSGGGDAIEAIRIGEIIRQYKLNTNAPFGTQQKPVCKLPLNDNSNCKCESACFLMYVAGIHRQASVLGIHRIYYNHDYLRQLPPSQAAEKHNEIKTIVTNYLIQMGTPKPIIEKMFTIQSGGMYFLKPDEIRPQLSGYLEEYSEWIVSKCGNFEQLLGEVFLIKMALNEKPSSELKKAFQLKESALFQSISCRKHESHKLAQEAFNKLSQ